jgi:hypothetical protein
MDATGEARLPIPSVPLGTAGQVSASRLDGGETFETGFGSAQVVTRAALIDPAVWAEIFGGTAKDGRYYQICETTLAQPNFDYRYLLLRDRTGKVRALQPLFFTDQDLLAGVGEGLRNRVGAIRRKFPRFLTMKMLMAGCTAGEGHLGVADPADTAAVDGLLEALRVYGRRQRAAIITFKDFPKEFRPALTAPAARRGFVRMPSFPATVIALEGFGSAEDYFNRRLGKSMRKNLRRKFRPDGPAQPPITMEVRTDVSDLVDELHPLYLQVLARSSFRFEELTPAYFRELGRTMGDRARFFIWRQEGRAVAVSLAMVHDGVFHDNYLGLDYAVALDRHLYFVTIRDLLDWAIGEKLHTYYSTPLNYDPKLHLRFALEPLDLYVRHTSAWLNPIFGRVAPLLEPTRYDRLLARFENFADLA